MIKKKTGFLTFIFSFLPGLAEMYMGFFKGGISLMAYFFGIIAISSWINLGPLLFILPIIWFYAFFHAHALAGMRDEEFYQLEDEFIIPFAGEQFKGAFEGKKGRNILAGILILIGVSALWRMVTDFIYDLASYINPVFRDGIYNVISNVPQCLIAILLIYIGIKMIRGKKIELDQIEEEEHSDGTN